MDIWKVLIGAIILFVVVIIVSVRVNNKKHARSLQEARVRGIKSALEEQRQYDALEKFDTDMVSGEPVKKYHIRKGSDFKSSKEIE